MNSESNNEIREQLEMRITALLLGEASAFEVSTLEELMAKDRELAAFHDRMKATIGLVSEASKKVAVEAPEPVAQPKLSVERRAALLAKFKEPKAAKVVALPQEEKRETAETRKARRKRTSWLIPTAAAAAIVVVAAGMLLPAMRSAKSRRQNDLSINNLREIDSVKQQWAISSPHSLDDSGGKHWTRSVASATPVVAAPMPTMTVAPITPDAPEVNANGGSGTYFGGVNQGTVTATNGMVFLPQAGPEYADAKAPADSEDLERRALLDQLPMKQKIDRDFDGNINREGFKLPEVARRKVKGEREELAQAGLEKKMRERRGFEANDLGTFVHFRNGNIDLAEGSTQSVSRSTIWDDNKYSASGPASVDRDNRPSNVGSAQSDGSVVQFANGAIGKGRENAETPDGLVSADRKSGTNSRASNSELARTGAGSLAIADDMEVVAEQPRSFRFSAGKQDGFALSGENVAVTNYTINAGSSFANMGPEPSLATTTTNRFVGRFAFEDLSGMVSKGARAKDGFGDSAQTSNGGDSSAANPSPVYSFNTGSYVNHGSLEHSLTGDNANAGLLSAGKVDGAHLNDRGAASYSRSAAPAPDSPASVADERSDSLQASAKNEGAEIIDRYVSRKETAKLAAATPRKKAHFAPSTPPASPKPVAAPASRAEIAKGGARGGGGSGSAVRDKSEMNGRGEVGNNAPVATPEDASRAATAAAAGVSSADDGSVDINVAPVLSPPPVAEADGLAPSEDLRRVQVTGQVANVATVAAEPPATLYYQLKTNGKGLHSALPQSTSASVRGFYDDEAEYAKKTADRNLLPNAGTANSVGQPVQMADKLERPRTRTLSGRQAAEDSAENKRLVAGDSMNMKVVEDGSRDGSYKVQADGRITIKGVGRVMVAGKTEAEAEKAIKESLAVNQIKDSTVTVDRAQPPEKVQSNSGSVAFDEKAALETKRRIRDVLATKLQEQVTESALPTSQIVKIYEVAKSEPSHEPTAGEKVRKFFTGQVERTARIGLVQEPADVQGVSGRQIDPFWIKTDPQVILSTNVLGKALDQLESSSRGRGTISREQAVRKLKESVVVEPVPNSSEFNIRAKSDKPDEAAGIANAVAASFSEIRSEEHRKLKMAGYRTLALKLAELNKEITEAEHRLEKSGETTPAPAANVQNGNNGSDAPIKKPSTPPPTPQPEIATRENAFSTFSLNVSDVSFKLAAASLQNNVMPDPGSIRVEEFINAFNYHDPAPAAGARLAFAWERAQYPFAHNRDVLRFGIQTAARGRDTQKPCNLVILLDNSGSMERPDRVAIIREALKVLAQKLHPQDRISVIAFARTARLWVDGMAGGNESEFLAKVMDLNPEGGTNLEEAMRLGYETALRHFMPNGVNRVILLTDGAANLGNVEPEDLKKKVIEQRQKGIALDCFGIGWEGFNDDLLEVLSSNGDGRYGFLNQPEQAAPEFADQLAGALNVAAADVKTQVEFNPNRVTSWRQIGYAKHQLKKEQFRDNTVDAAEIAAAEQGNALYVIETNPQGSGPIAVVRVRFKNPDTGDYSEQEWPLEYQPRVAALDQSSPALRLAVGASAFGEWLSTSPFAAEVTLPALENLLSDVPNTFAPDPRPQQLQNMIRAAQGVVGK